MSASTINKSEGEYYESLSDYDDIKKYLTVDEPDFEPPFNPPPFTPNFTNAIIIDNLPKITIDRIPKLKLKLIQLYEEITKNINDDDFYMPIDNDSKLTYGFSFIKFNTQKDAELAVKKTQNLKFGSNLLRSSSYCDLDRYKSISEVYSPSEPATYSILPDPTSWLCDPKSRDQFVTRFGLETEIGWANLTGENPTLIYDGNREKQGGKVWCEQYVQWSPKGTYLATFHNQGIRLWGNDKFEPLGRYLMPYVESVEFSPCENYLITYRYDANDVTSTKAIIVWDVLSGQEIRSFDMKNPRDINFQVQATVVTTIVGDTQKKPIERIVRGRVKSYTHDKRGGTFAISEGTTVHEEVHDEKFTISIPTDKVIALQDPNKLKWSYDGKYVARLGNDLISIYSLPSMELLSKKSLSAKEVLDFAWSPASNMVSYWSPAVGNHPAIINIISVPDREEICSRKIFDVSDGRMVWQNDGDYLCVYMTKVQGKKKTHPFMFFRVKQPGVPVELVELPETVITISWEPSGDRLAIVHGEARNPSVSFYCMNGVNPKSVDPKLVSKIKKELTLLYTVTGSSCNEIYWSPAGSIIALAYFASDACMFELHDVENNVKLAARRHDRCNRLYWDPSGRVIASCTITQLRNLAARGQADDGFNLYTFQGTPICQVRREKLCQFSWRPRPKDLLTADDRKRVIKNLKKYEKIFDKEDRTRRQELHQAMVAFKNKTAEDFLARINRNKNNIASYKKMRVSLRNGYDSDDDRNYTIENIVDETIVSSKDQIVQ